jgi:hypothetical protein
MRSAILLPLCAALALLSGCGSEPAPAPTPVKKAAAPPADESRRFPVTDRVDTTIVAEHILGHDFLPGGNLAHYKKGKVEYDLILIRCTNAQAAGILLFDYKTKLENPKVVPGFGGFAGKDGARDAFLFAKGPFLLGILGLPQDDADLVARQFATRIE